MTGPDDERDIPRFVRRCWERYMQATEEERKAEKVSLGFWVGGKHQWHPGETERRQSKNQPWISINRCKPAVDQVENEARNNPPGPQAHPVGGGADKDGADILEGLIREYEYRSDAKTAYIMALRFAAAGGRGVFEMGTAFAGERTMEQQIIIKLGEDPSTYFYDPDARLPCREDSMWGGKIRVLSREALTESYGASLKVLNRSLIDRLATGAGSWMRDAIGWTGDYATTSVWTGGTQNKGPYYVCEFYKVTIERKKLRLWSDNILRFEDENPPRGVTPKQDKAGEEIERSVPIRTVKKYVVTALDVLEETDWYGSIVPHFWVLGPEMRVDGKLYRLSLITNAQDAQRGLNYTATSALQIVGGMTKSPWIGFEGQFDVANAQGMNPWESSNSEMWAYMEVKPVFATNAVTGQQELLPPPQRNTWEAPIAKLMELATFFGEQIKAATAVFFEPSLPSAAQAQSGSAIKALQSQTNIGTLNWQDQLHRAVQISYGEAAKILPKIYDGARARTIVRADSQHEIQEINREFPLAEIDAPTGKHRTKDGKLESLNNITLGQYSLRVTAGPSFETRTEKSIENLTEVFHIVPNLLANPALAARFLRMVGEGNPQVEAMADALSPDESQEASPDQMRAKLQQSQQQTQQLQALAQKMQQALAAKLPEIEANKFKALLDSLTKIRVAEITASKDLDRAGADREAATLEHLTGMAHDAATQATEHEHAAGMQQQQQAAATQQQDQGHRQALEQQQAAQQAEPAEVAQ